MELQGGRLGSLTAETFELGPLAVVIFVGALLIAVFLPLLFLVSRFAKLSGLNTALVGFFSALLSVVVRTWPVLTDSTLRWNFRLQQLADSYPWLAMGVIGGALFWLLAIHRNRVLNQ